MAAPVTECGLRLVKPVARGVLGFPFALGRVERGCLPTGESALGELDALVVSA